MFEACEAFVWCLKDHFYAIYGHLKKKKKKKKKIKQKIVYKSLNKDKRKLNYFLLSNRDKRERMKTYSKLYSDRSVYIGSKEKYDSLQISTSKNNPNKKQPQKINRMRK